MDTEYVDAADAETRLQAVLHGIGIVLAAFGAGIAFSLVGQVGLWQFDAMTTASGELISAGNAIVTALQFVGFIVAVLAYVKWYSDRSLIGLRLPSLRDIGLVVGGFLALIGLSAVLSVVISLLGVEVAQNAAVGQGQENPEYFLYLIPISLLLVGPGEELVFRGVVQGVFKRAYGVVPGILIASLFFGVSHVIALLGQGLGGIVTYLAIAGILGIVLGTVYELTDNIVVPAVIHGAWNAIQFFGQWYAATHDVEMLFALLPT